MSKIICSIIIINWKSIDYLLKCIRKIKCNTHYSYEIIVVDNFSGIAEQKKLKELIDIKLILNNENKGFASAINQGLKIVNGQFILLLNPDTIILNKAIDKMINFLQNNIIADAVAPKLYSSEKLDYHPSVKTFPSPFRQLLIMLPMSGLFYNSRYRFKFITEKIRRVNCVWGAAIMFKKDVFQKVGYFDERFFLYAEEIDFCKRMLIAGLKIYYYPESEIIHYGGISQQKASIPKNILIWNSLLNYFDKYFSERNIRRNMYLLLIFLKSEVFLLKRYELLNVIDVIEKKLSTN